MLDVVCWCMLAAAGKFFFPLSPGHVNLPFGFDQPWHLWCKQNKVEMVGFPCLGLLHHLSQIGSGTQHVWKTRWPTPLLAFALGQCYATHWSTTCGCNPFWCRKWSESKGLKWFQFWSSRVERLFAHGNSLWDLWHVPKFYHNWFFFKLPPNAAIVQAMVFHTSPVKGGCVELFPKFSQGKHRLPPVLRKTTLRDR